MKNDPTVPSKLPFDLQPDEFFAYFSALSAWTTAHASDLEGLFQDFLADCGGEDSAPARAEFNRHFFFECQAGRQFLRKMQRSRKRGPNGKSTP